MPEHAGASRIRGRPCEHLFARRPPHPTGFVLTHQHRVRGVFASPRVPSRPKYRNGMWGGPGSQTLLNGLIRLTAPSSNGA